ncbi:hypothetical protein [Amycolatopsis acidicola]|uniref:hypothetical protein n=1 Tax=Amycolatopsis acidicola TaxID=2596893 RepID=UPI0014075FBB|nr:hypothetical protein [Amycolatopsis acidicola]
MNSTGRQLVDQANAAQTANKNLLGPSESGVVGGHGLSTTGPLNTTGGRCWFP